MLLFGRCLPQLAVHGDSPDRIERIGDDADFAYQSFGSRGRFLLLYRDPLADNEQKEGSGADRYRKHNGQGDASHLDTGGGIEEHQRSEEQCDDSADRKNAMTDNFDFEEE